MSALSWRECAGASGLGWGSRAEVGFLSPTYGVLSGMSAGLRGVCCVGCAWLSAEGYGCS